MFIAEVRISIFTTIDVGRGYNSVCSPESKPSNCMSARTDDTPENLTNHFSTASNGNTSRRIHIQPKSVQLSRLYTIQRPDVQTTRSSHREARPCVFKWKGVRTEIWQPWVCYIVAARSADFLYLCFAGMPTAKWTQLKLCATCLATHLELTSENRPTKISIIAPLLFLMLSLDTQSLLQPTFVIYYSLEKPQTVRHKQDQKYWQPSTKRHL
jgi:hypothetical protein